LNRVTANANASTPLRIPNEGYPLLR
jgi:hypothetical protein